MLQYSYLLIGRLFHRAGNDAELSHHKILFCKAANPICTLHRRCLQGRPRKQPRASVARPTDSQTSPREDPDYVLPSHHRKHTQLQQQVQLCCFLGLLSINVYSYSPNTPNKPHLFSFSSVQRKMQTPVSVLS